MYFSETGFTGFIGFFIACGEATFGRRPFYPDNPVDPDSADDRKAFEASLTKFLDASEFIVTKHVGTPAATAHRDVVDGSYTYSLLLTFKNKADQDAYQDEAVHKTFIEESAHLWTKVLVYDSENILN